MVVEDLDLNVNVVDNATDTISDIRSDIQDLDDFDEVTVDVRVNNVDDIDLDALESDTTVDLDGSIQDADLDPLEEPPEIPVHGRVTSAYVEYGEVGQVNVRTRARVEKFEPVRGAGLNELTGSVMVEDVDVSDVEPAELTGRVEVNDIDVSDVEPANLSGNVNINNVDLSEVKVDDIDVSGVETAELTGNVNVNNVDLSEVEPADLSARVEVDDVESNKLDQVKVDDVDVSNVEPTDLISRALVADVNTSSVEPVEVDAVLDIDGALRDGFETSSAFKRANGSGTSFVRRDDDIGIRPASREDALGEIEEVVGARTVEMNADIVDVNSTLGATRTRFGGASRPSASTSGGSLLPTQIDLGLGEGVDLDDFDRQRRLLDRRAQREGDNTLADTKKSLNDILSDIDIQFNDVYSAIARVLPFLVTAIASVPALISGLVALTGAAIAAAGALYAVGGLAVIGVGLEDGEFDIENFDPLIERLREAFISSFGPLANDLAPLVTEGVTLLEDILPRVADAVGPAARSIAGDIRDLFEVARDTLPTFAARISQVAAAFTPFLAPLARLVLDSGIFAQIARFGADILPTLALLGRAIFEALPPLLEFSRGFLRVFTAVSLVIGGFLSFIQTIGAFLGIPILRPLGVLIGLFLTFTSVLLIANASLGTFIARIAVAAVDLVATYTPAIIGTTAAKVALTAVTITLVGVLTFGLAPVVGGLAGAFSGLSGEIDGATESLRQFGLEQRRLGGGPGGFGGGLGGGGVTVDNRSYDVEVNNDVSGSSGNGKSIAFESERTWDRIFSKES